MPIKVRCKGCQKVLNVPDRARGKAIKCPQCETVLRIPASKTAAGKADAPQRARQRQPVSQPVDEDNPLAGVDLRRAADSRVRVCVKCGTEVDEEVIDCPSCGHNVDTGIMSEQVRKKRARRGPDPDEYWSVAWTGSLKYVKDNLPLVWRTAGYWVVFGTLFVWSSFWFTFFNMVVGLQFETGTFFIGLLSLFYFGGVGWFWHLNRAVIEHTMGPRRNKKFDIVHFDFFLCVGKGIVAAVWPYLLFFLVMVPIFIYVAIVAINALIAGAFSGSDVSDTLLGIKILLYVLSALFVVLSIMIFPLAQVHMSMPYTYKAFTPYHMAIALGKNILPSLYYFVQALAAILPFALTALILHISWEGGLVALAGDIFVILFDLADWVLELVGIAPPEDDIANRGWWNFILVQTIIPVAAAVFLTPLCIAMAFGAVFLMRANGYIGLYFSDKLDLVKEQQPNVPCGFWPRYLAFLVDTLIIQVALLLIWLLAFGIIFLLNMIGIEYLVKLVMFAYNALCFIFPWLYFARPQSQYGAQASIGKAAIGLIVTDDDGGVMSFGQATGRYFIKSLLSNFVMIGIGSIICAFTERKRATHDQMVGSLVVWKGDDERDQI